MTDEFKIEYFKILEELRNSKEIGIWPIDARLENIRDKQDRKSIQFSFITKLLNTIDNNISIYDAEIAKLFGFKRPSHSKSRGDRLEEYDYQHLKMYLVYEYIIANKLLYSIFEVFDKKFPKTNISQTKKLDFICWQAGKLMTLKVTYY